MILLGILRQQQNHIWRLCPSSTVLLRSTSVSPVGNAIRLFGSDQHLQKDRSLLTVRAPVLIHQPYRTRKLKFSFGYTNYGHRRHIRPPGHHVVQYLQFFFMIIGAYGLFYLTNVTEFEERWSQPINTNPAVEMNTYINPVDAQRRLDVFSQVKAATILPAVDTATSDSEEENQADKLSEVSISSSHYSPSYHNE